MKTHLSSSQKGHHSDPMGYAHRHTAPFLVAGVSMEIGGLCWVIPPLSLGSLEQLQGRLSKLHHENIHEQIGLLIDTALAALQRNYPSLTRETVALMVDMHNATDIFAAIMNISNIPQTRGTEINTEAGEQALGEG